MTRSGITLVELLLSLVLMGMLALIGLSPLNAVRQSQAVRAEQRRLADALETARSTAVRLGVPTRLTLSDTSYLVTAVSLQGDSITAWRQGGPASQGVRLTGSGAAILFGPSGVAMGASNRTLTLQRGAITRTVVISRLGRITQ